MSRLVRISGLVAAFLVAFAGGAFGVRAHRRAREARETARLWADFSACVIGEPLAPGEKLEERTRGIMIAIDRIDDAFQKLPNDAWPLSCISLHDTFVSSELVDRAAPGLRAAVDAGWTQLVSGRERSLVGFLPALSIAARSLEVVPASPGVVHAPRPAVPLIRDHKATLPAPVVPLAFRRERSDDVVVVSAGRRCTVPDFRCAPVPALPDVANADGPTEVHVGPDGTVTQIAPVIGTPRWGVESTYRIVRGRDRLDLPPGAYDLHVVGDALIGNVGSDFVARPIQTTGPLLGEPIRLDQARDNARWSWCPTSSLGAFVWSSRRIMYFDETYDELRVVEAPSYRLVTSVKLARGGPPAVECTAEGATFVWTESKNDTHLVRRLRCTHAGCTEDSREVSGIRPSRFVITKSGLDVGIRAAPLGGDQVVLAWTGLADAVWVTTGPLADLATTPRRVLYDLSRDPWCDRMQLEAHPGGAVLALRLSKHDAMLFEIARDGHASAIEAGSLPASQ